MSACPSSPITVLAAGSDSAAVPDRAAADPAGEDLLFALSVVSDPGKSGGGRHGHGRTEPRTPQLPSQ